MPGSRFLPTGLFVLLLLTPALSAITGTAFGPPLQENRTLVAQPALHDYVNRTKVDWLGFSSHFNGWFSDQFPTRNFWVRLQGQLLYSLFRESSQVHIGKDGWLYYRSVLDVENMTVGRITPEEQLAMVQRLQRLSQQLQERGIQLYVLPLGLKDYYYPENLPSSGQHALQFRFYDEFMDALLANGSINVIDSRPVLRQAKDSGLKIFHQTDFHWTDPAGVKVFQALLAAIAADEQKPALATQWQIEPVEATDWSGGESHALPLLWPLTETTVQARVTGTVTQFNPQAALPAGVEAAALAATPRADLLAPVLVFGDSFFDSAARTGFFNVFQGYTQSRVWTFDLVDAYRNRQPGTRYVVLENITSAVFGMDTAVAKLSEALAADPDF